MSFGLVQHLLSLQPLFVNTAGMIVTLNSFIPNARIAQTQMFFSLENISAAIWSPCYLD